MSLKILVQNVHILISPKKAWWRDVFASLKSNKCIIFNFLGVLNAMSIFLWVFLIPAKIKAISMCIFQQLSFWIALLFPAFAPLLCFLLWQLNSHCLEKGDVNSLYFCFYAGNVMQHSPDSVKQVTVKVFRYMKTGAKCTKAGGKEALKLTNTQGNKQWKQGETKSLEKIKFKNENCYM